MQRVIRDDMVAVLYSPNHGAGWYTWHGLFNLIFDPKVVELVEKKNSLQCPSKYKRTPEYMDIVAKIEDYCESSYGDDHYYGGADDLVVEWLPVGTKFFIDEYDGAETVKTMDSIQWTEA